MIYPPWSICKASCQSTFPLRIQEYLGLGKATNLFTLNGPSEPIINIFPNAHSRARSICCGKPPTFVKGADDTVFSSLDL
ncbi:hypothetical protein AQUCO_26700003v1 [Aquilegia coerulea]|uniref:Uncharacterized protein n=1 Tax=Aquilegia coerulea TaxID=218851 RepID=A0A2G5C0M8_AQUCA|nr:hypothetical protein AQUCO_26700003v1 [Aquilegia coerulea]